MLAVFFGFTCRVAKYSRSAVVHTQRQQWGQADGGIIDQVISGAKTVWLLCQRHRAENKLPVLSTIQKKRHTDLSYTKGVLNAVLNVFPQYLSFSKTQ